MAERGGVHVVSIIGIVIYQVLVRKSGMEESGKFDYGRNRWCSYHSSNGHSNEKCHQQKKSSKCKDSSTVDGEKSGEK